MNALNPQAGDPPLAGGTPPYAADRQLIDRLIGGNIGAWHALVAKYGPLVRDRVVDVASAFGRADDHAVVDDATAEVFAALIANEAAPLRAFRGRSSLASYLSVIATRSATRSFARHRLVLGSGNGTTGAPETADPSIENAAGQEPTGADSVARMIDTEQHSRVQSLMDRLSPNQRSVAVLFHLQGQSYAQISQKLEMPIGTVGQTLRSAEARLQELMEDRES